MTQTMPRITLVGVLALVIPGAGFAQPSDGESGSEAHIAIFKLSGPVLEAPPSFEFDWELKPQRSLYDLVNRLNKAAKDAEIRAVVLTFEDPMFGLGQMQELAAAVQKLRAADKEVYCYLEDAGATTYMLATAASRIYLSPTGMLDLVGIRAQAMYFKGLMDKIGVSADILHVGAYKGAGEPFTRTEPSEESREMLNWLVDDLFEQMIERVAEGRHLPEDKVRELIDRGPFMAQQALEANLVDETMYAEDFADALRKRYGEEAVFVHDYGADRGPELDFSGLFAFWKSLGEAMQAAQPSHKPAVAVVYVDGMIVTGVTERGLFGESGVAGSTTLRRVLADARDDDTIQAVVLRVDSPGGSALASDIIWHATTEVRGEKPFVVSMGDMAASGGYYVSAGGSTLFADEGTLTGSIGVVGGKFVTKGLWDWLGISFYEEKRGQNAGLSSSLKPYDDRERALVRQQMESIYQAFTDRVRQGRGDRLEKDLDELAGGRVFTGRQALDNGLIDRIGGLQEAIAFAAEQAHLDEYDVRLLPEPMNFLELLLSMGRESDDERDIRLGRSLGTGLTHDWIRQHPDILRVLDPQRRVALVRSLLRIELLLNEPVLCVLPGEIIVR
jgi:protease-4